MIAANSPGLASHPCLILAHTDAGYAAIASRTFRRLGWDVYPARTGPEARRLARMLRPNLVVLQADLPDESGWLTCAKFALEAPELPILLVADSPGPCEEDFAVFVGAEAVVPLDAGPGGLLARVPQVVAS